MEREHVMERFEQGVRRVRQCLAGNYSKDQFNLLKTLMGDQAERFVGDQVARSCWEEIDRARILCLAFLVKDANVMLLGPYGAGKTYSVNLASEIFGQKMHRVQGSVSTDPANFTGQVDVKAIVEDNAFGLVVPEYARSGGKPAALLVDEINRMAPHEMNYLTSLLAERKLDSEAKHALNTEDGMIDVKGLTCFATRNKQDSATFAMPYHCVDRFSMALLFELDNVGTIEAKGNYKVLKANLGSLTVLDGDALEQARAQVERMPVRLEAVTFLDMFTKQFSHCAEHGSQREFVAQDPCGQCSKKGELCSCLEQDFYLSGRAKEQILDFARAEAYVRGAPGVGVEHTLPFLFPAVVHKLRLKPNVAAQVLASEEFRKHLPASSVAAGTLPYYDAAYALVRSAEATAREATDRLSDTRGPLKRELKTLDQALYRTVFARLTGGEAGPSQALLDDDLFTSHGFNKTVDARWFVSQLSQRLAAAEEVLAEFGRAENLPDLTRSLSLTGQGFLKAMVKAMGEDPYVAKIRTPEHLTEEDDEDLMAVGMGR